MLFINNIKIAIRNAMRNRLFSIINIVGLALGLACCLVIVLFVTKELSYDKHYTDADRIYRVGLDAKLNDSEFRIPSSVPPLGKTLKADYADIESYTRIENPNSLIISIDEKKFNVDKIIGADSTFFDFFNTKFIEGNKDALKKAKSIVITKTMAEQYFKSTEAAIGKTISFDKKDYNVAAVVEDCPNNTHLKYIAVYTLINERRAESDDWSSDGMMTYIKTTANTDYKKLEKEIQKVVDIHVAPLFKQYLNIELKLPSYYRYYLMPLTDIHLHSQTIIELEEGGNIIYVNMFIIIAIFILLIACINFSNLTTAKASKRAKEIGIKKSMGSSRARLMAQFFSESIFISLISFIFALVIVETSLPYISDFIGVQLPSDYYSNITIMSIFIGIAVLTGLISGSYSAIYLSSFNPVKILKGELTQGRKSARFRGALVIFQFSISIFLIISTLIINKQFNYIQNKDLGYNKKDFIKIENADVIKDKDAFKQRILEISGVQSATFASDMPGKFCNGNMIQRYNSEDKNGYNIRLLQCDEDFIKTMGCKVLEGRFFSKDFKSDSTAIIINEEVVKEMGLTNPLETDLCFLNDKVKYKVIGVIKNYHDVSLKTKVQPLVMTYNNLGWMSLDNLGIRLNAEANASSLNMIENVWKEFTDASPFNYVYMEDVVTKLHIKEKNNLKIFTAFSFLAIFIACIGLLGLVSFTIDQKVKEIGIRKINGAPVSSIMLALNKEIIKWIAISFVIACPCAYYIMDNWLQDFIYKIDIGAMVFIISGLSTMFISLAAVSWQALRAARMNPVKCLRYE